MLIYERICGGGGGVQKNQNCHRIKCYTPMKSWCSGVSENILYMFCILAYFCQFDTSLESLTPVDLKYDDDDNNNSKNLLSQVN